MDGIASALVRATRKLTHGRLCGQAPWLLMIETDYVWLKPVAAPMAESSALSIAFPFGYIDPLAPALKAVMRKMYPESAGPLSDVPASGPAPVLMRWQELFKVRQAPSPHVLLAALLSAHLGAPSKAAR